ncbi:MAG: LysM peptidoglycan-binding domain-containing protein [Planctomycetota bacterium]
MGSFEKLGILVIVVIITMILAVAIYQWGGTSDPFEPATAGVPSLNIDKNAVPAPTPEVDLIDEHEKSRAAPGPDAAGGSSAGTGVGPRGNWPGGIPKSYVVQAGDSLWVVVVRRWKLKDSFTDAIGRANPDVNVAKLNVGDTLRIPNPDAYRRDRSSSAAPARRNLRRYEVQIGDRLDLIAKRFLDSHARWREIQAVNPGLDPAKLRPGQVIYIPAK